MIGTTAINGTGNNLSNTIIGNGAANILNGSAGADTLTGGAGADKFVFQFGQSTVASTDRVTDFGISSDKIDLLTASGGALPAPLSFTRAVNNGTASTRQALMTRVFVDANGATAGNQALGINQAALVVSTNTAIAGTYLIVNDGVAGFQSGSDLLVNITGLSGKLPVLGPIPVANFFV